MTHAPRRARALLVAALLSAPLALAACSDDGGSSDEPGTKDDAASHSSVEFRRVVSSASSQKQCSASPEKPSEEACAALADLACPTEAQDLDDDYLLACGTDAYRSEGFLLAGTEISKGIESAEAGKPEDHGWVIDLTLSPDATKTFAELTADLAGTGRQVALVVDGKVVSAPAPATTIEDGRLRLELGDVGQKAASDLARRLAS
jgi:preprotein translocase subunit SecD